MIMKIVIRAWLILCLMFISTFAMVVFANGDKDKKNDPTVPVKRTQVAVPAQQILEQQAMSALNNQLSGLMIKNTTGFVPSASFLAEATPTATVSASRDSARAIITNMIQSGYFIDLDTETPKPLNPVKMPIGLKKHFGTNNIVYVAFSKAVLRPTHAEVTAFVKIDWFVEDGKSGTTKKRELYFGANRIKITNSGNVVGDARLVLLGDYTIPMFNGKMKLVLKGGEINKADGGFLKDDLTFAILDCNGYLF
jgi:hypothetical protein